jgi:hypothetical protein
VPALARPVEALLTMPKLYLGEALALIGKTLPFIWVRLASYAVLGVGLLAYAGVIGGIAWLLGQLWAPLGLILFLATIGGAFAVVRWASRYYFHLLGAAHTAVMTEFIVHGRGPEGSQLAHGRRAVEARFRDTSVLFAIDVLVAGAVKAFVRSFVRLGRILPIPGSRGFANLVERVALMSTSYVDEAILSRAYREREQNVWKVAHDGVILYAQAWQPILANAVVLAVLGYVEFLLVLVALGLPALVLAAAFPSLALPLGVFVVVAAWMIKLAVADALSLAATLVAYHRGTEGMVPNPEWKAKLEGVSDRFRELGRKANEVAGDRVDVAAALPWQLGRDGPAPASASDAPSPDAPPVPGTPPGPGAPPTPDTPGAPPHPPVPDTPEPPSGPAAPEPPDGPGLPPRPEPIEQPSQA